MKTSLKQKIELAKSISPDIKEWILSVFNKLSERDKEEISIALFKERLYIGDCKNCLIKIDNLFNKYKKNIRKKIEYDSKKEEIPEDILNELESI